MRVYIHDNILDLIPTRKEEKEFLQNIVSMKFDPIIDTSSEGDITLVNFKKLRLFCQLNQSGTKFDDISIET